MCAGPQDRQSSEPEAQNSAARGAVPGSSQHVLMMTQRGLAQRACSSTAHTLAQSTVDTSLLRDDHSLHQARIEPALERTGGRKRELRRTQVNRPQSVLCCA